VVVAVGVVQDPEVAVALQSAVEELTTDANVMVHRNEASVVHVLGLTVAAKPFLLSLTVTQRPRLFIIPGRKESSSSLSLFI